MNSKKWWQWELFDIAGNATPEALKKAKEVQELPQSLRITQSVPEQVEQKMQGVEMLEKSPIQVHKNRKEAVFLGNDQYDFWYPKNCIAHDEQGNIVWLELKIRKKWTKSYMRFKVSFWDCVTQEYTNHSSSHWGSYFATKLSVSSIQKLDASNGWARHYSFNRYTKEAHSITSFNYFSAPCFGGFRPHAPIVQNIGHMISSLCQESKNTN